LNWQQERFAASKGGRERAGEREEGERVEGIALELSSIIDPKGIAPNTHSIIT